MAIELASYTEDDMVLTAAIECDPAMMVELGGPMPRERIPDIHRRRLAHITKGAWYFKIIPDGGREPAGTIGIWDSAWKGAPIHEMCWMVRPAFQGRGLASGAARMILERARRQGKFAVVHAFTGISNGPSNAICRKLGFAKLEECDIEYAGRPLRCNHWRLDLAAGFDKKSA